MPDSGSLILFFVAMKSSRRETATDVVERPLAVSFPLRAFVNCTHVHAAEGEVSVCRQVTRAQHVTQHTTRMFSLHWLEPNDELGNSNINPTQRQIDKGYSYLPQTRCADRSDFLQQHLDNMNGHLLSRSRVCYRISQPGSPGDIQHQSSPM